MEKTFEPTPEQQAIQAKARERQGSLMITAFAGCAKTSTLELAAQEIKVPALGLAFAKADAKRMVETFPENFVCKTSNAFGHGVWARTTDRRLTLDDRKMSKIVSQILKDRKIDKDKDLWGNVLGLVGKAMQVGLIPSSLQAKFGEGLVPDSSDVWCGLGDDLWLSEEQTLEIKDLAREALEQSIQLAISGTISFDDQIYAPLMLGGRFPQFPVVFGDEAQDWTAMQQLLVEKSLRPGGRLAIVGDPKQAIYAWRGAQSDSMRVFRKRQQRLEWTDLKLSLTFRCPKVVVERQQGHVPGFRAHERNKLGSFARWMEQFGLESEFEGWNEKKLFEQSSNPRDEIAILCRNNGPLLAMAFKLIRKGIGVQMLGRDIGKGLILLSNKLAKEDSTPTDIVRGKILEWQESESSKALANGQDGKIAGITDRAECLLAVLEGSQCKDAGQMREMITKIFSAEDGQITLSSIHRAKGKEWDVVLHLDPWRVPSKFARKAARAGDSRQLEQEFNLIYVCETRSKNVLLQANLEDFQ